MSSVAQADIERIVREVIEQLKLVAPPAAAPMVAAPATSLRSNGELYIDARIVTLESIAGRLNGAKQLVVSPGALVTPSVRDELRRRGVELIQDAVATKTKKPLVPVVLVAGRTGQSAELAVAMLRQEGIEVQRESSNCLIEATQRLSAAVAAGSLGVLWTRHTAVGLCLGNRRRGVRAVLATGVPATAAAVAAVAANVLVVDPTIGTTYEKKQVLREFCLGGIRECPEDLKKGLE